MIHSSLVRRCAGASGALVLALAGLGLAATPADGAVLDGMATASTNFATSGGGGCALSADTHTSSNQPYGSGGTVASFNLNTSAVATDPGDLTDTTQLAANISGTVSAQEAAGAVTGFAMNSNIALKVDRAQDALSSCSSSALATMIMTTPVPFNVPAPTLLDLTSKFHGSNLTVSSVTLVLSKTNAPPASDTEVPFNFNASVQRYLAVPAGQYSVTVVVTTQLSQPSTPPVGENATATWSLDAKFLTPGVAKTAQQGTGNKYLTLGSAVSCTSDTVTADFTNKAGKKAKKGKKPVLNKATFYVNDVKVASVKKPNKNTLTTLTGLPDEDEVTVEAVIKVRGKGPVAVRRTYRPCT